MAQQLIGVGTSVNDDTGDPNRTAFQKTNANFTEIYSLQSQTINAGSADYLTAGSIENRVQAAITDAVTRGYDRVRVPTSMLPYNAALITFSTAVQMVREGGAEDVYDVMAYGAYGNNIINDASAVLAAIAGAQLIGGRVYFPHPPVRYYISTTSLSITANGVILEASDPSTFLTYSGTDYAIKFGTTGPSQIHSCGAVYLGVVCTHLAGSAYYAKSPYGFFIDRVYCENGLSGTTGAGITIDGGNSAGSVGTGTGYFATQVKLMQCRSSAFNKGIVFKGGSLSGWDITTGSTVDDCFVNGLSGNTGSIGIEFQGSQQCRVRGGNLEVLDTGVKLTSTPNACAGITLDAVRFESIAVKNWDIPADAIDTVIIGPRWNTDSGVDLALDTILIQDNRVQFPAMDEVKLNAAPITCVNGNNNHTLAIGRKSLVRISGPTAAFAIGGFSGAAAVDGKVVDVITDCTQVLTINNNDPSTAANCSIRTGTAANVVVGAGTDTVACSFRYNADYLQWQLISHQP